MMKRMDILDTKVSVTNLREAGAYIDDCIREGRKTYICVAPVSTIVDAQSDQEYRNIINSSGMTTPDGMPLVWLGKLKGERAIGRTYGPDLMLQCCDLGQAKGYKHFFYGGTEESNALLISRLREKFPRINIAGGIAPPFRAVGEKESLAVLEQMNAARPDIVWVGLGSPKQDYWMDQHRGQLNAPVLAGVGAAFDLIAGVKKQAPLWMRNSGLEWFFRLCSEPGRLWKRYLVGNTKFVYYVIKDAMKASQVRL